jgi:hypothetical protein
LVIWPRHAVSALGTKLRDARKLYGTGDFSYPRYGLYPRIEMVWALARLIYFKPLRMSMKFAVTPWLLGGHKYVFFKATKKLNFCISYLF